MATVAFATPLVVPVRFEQDEFEMTLSRDARRAHPRPDVDEMPSESRRRDLIFPLVEVRSKRITNGRTSRPRVWMVTSVWRVGAPEFGEWELQPFAACRRR